VTTQLDLLAEKAIQLSDGFPEKMVILDCETTGGKSTYHRIIELGYLIIENGVCISKHQQFINPETHIPPGIQQLTGIVSSMLKDAPRFAEIAGQLFDVLDDHILVAHNARFDYGFLKNEFKRCGINYRSKQLCSVKFSRRLYPQFKRHGLDQIIKRFHFNINNRHRALDDAEIVYRFFLKSSALFHQDDIAATCADLLKMPALPVKLDPAEVEKLPNRPGVYHFYDEQGGLLYVGKSVNIRGRVLSHFNQDYRNNKDLKLSSKIAHVDYTTTPSDFSAQILESQQIKFLQPLHNFRLRRVRKLYQIKLYENKAGYLSARIEMISSDASLDDEKFGLFRSPRQAMTRLEKLADQYFLCHQLLGLEHQNNMTADRACFRYQLKKCLGACVCEEPADSYNQRIIAALKDYEIKCWPWNSAVVIEERDASDSDYVVWHLVYQWRYIAKVSNLSELYEFGYRPLEQHSGLPDAEQQYDTTGDNNNEFDLDIYFILIRFLMDPELKAANRLTIWECAAVNNDFI